MSSSESLTSTQNDTATVLTLDGPSDYKKIDYHWFYNDSADESQVWLPLSHKDSKHLELYYDQHKNDILLARDSCSSITQFVCQIQGGRFDADLVQLVKQPAYWSGKKSKLQRCLWFYKDSSVDYFQPYPEEYCDIIEKYYSRTVLDNAYHQRITNELNPDETFIFHSTNIMVHFVRGEMIDEFGNLDNDGQRPRILKRGIDDVVESVEPDEPDRIDHLFFVVHGVGEAYGQLKPHVDCVNDVREIGKFIVESYFKASRDSGIVSRIEFLPVCWHEELHAEPTGSDSRLKSITPKSISKIRHFANSTFSELLFYTSPKYCQLISQKVGFELNTLYEKFRQRNKAFNGKVSLIGHSLGSLILFDILSHQIGAQHIHYTPSSVSLLNQTESSQPTSDLKEFFDELGLCEYYDRFEMEKINMSSLLLLDENDLKQMGLSLSARQILMVAMARQRLKKEREDIESLIKTNLTASQLDSNPNKNFKYGLAATSQPLVKYPSLEFQVENFFAMGSPVPYFLNFRGVKQLPVDYKLPTCKGYFNIFHPFDTVAFRMESLVDTNLSENVEPVLMPHHLGGKRLHLKLRDELTKFSGDMRKMIAERFNFKWSSITSRFPGWKKSTESTEVDVDVDDFVQTHEPTSVDELNIKIGKLNRNGRRIDYVLQESPIESVNEYLFALTAHSSYWTSEDTLMLIVKETYDCDGILPDPPLQVVESQSIASSFTSFFK